MFFTSDAGFPYVNDGKIETIAFLEACKEAVRFVELLGKVFAPVKYDINGNIEKLYSICNTDIEKFSTLNDIIQYELNDSVPKIGIDALLWLKRALEYIHSFLDSLVNDSKGGNCPENLVPMFNKAYEETLKPYHGWLVQKVFGLIVHAAPTRKSLIQLLAGEEANSEEETLKNAEAFLQGLNSNLKVINDIYQKHNLDSPAKV